MNQNNQVGFVLPEHIRASLSKYNEHEQLTCLECGYSGLMGVSKKVDRVSKAKSWTIIGSVVAILALVGLYRTTMGMNCSHGGLISASAQLLHPLRLGQLKPTSALTAIKN